MDVDREGATLNSGNGQNLISPSTGRAKSPQSSRSDASPRVSSGQSVLNLVTCILGAGVLGFPYCFKSCGLVLATLIMAASLLATRFSYQLLLYCCQLSPRRSYEELAEQAVGRVGRVLVQLCTVALNLGAVVAYLNILADVISSVAGTIIPPGAEPSRSAYLAGVTLLGALPVGLMVRDHALVAAFSTASVGFIVLFATVIVIFSLLPAYSIASGAVVMWRSEGLLVAFPVMAYGFTAHPYYLGIFQNLNGSGVRKMADVTDMGMSIAATLYWVVGMGGYMTFRARTSGDLLRNLGAAHAVGLRGAYERAIKLCYGLSILGAIPLVITPFHGALLAMLGPQLETTTHASAPAGDGGGGGGGGLRRHRWAEHLGTAGGMLADGRVGAGAACSLGGRTCGGCRAQRASAFQLAAGRASRAGQLLAHNSDPDLSKPGFRGSLDGGERSKLAPGGLLRSVAHDAEPSDQRAQQRAAAAMDFGGRSYIDTSTTRHVMVVFVVLGLAMASAIWVPNVEFIFGLTGATASVIISYILPAVTFIKLLEENPDLTRPLGTTSSLKSNAGDARWVWVWRKRQAMALLIFGLISGVLCTDAILGAVKEEAVVVQLAQRIAAREAAVQETTRVQQKAQQAVAAVSVVETASKELSAAHINATDTIDQLQQAANALQAIASVNSSSTGAKSMWDLHGLVKERKQHADEGKVLRSVEATLVSVRAGMRASADSVALVVQQVNSAQAQFKAEKQAEDAAARKAETAAEEVADASAIRSRSKATQASDLAADLAKALGLFGNVAQNETVAAGKSLEQVRASAVTALQALNTTINVLNKVSSAVAAAQLNHKHDSEIKEVAAAAMQLALNATASSTLAMQMTSDALARSANEEASDLLSMLTQVATDMQRKRSRVADPSPKPVAAGLNTGIRKVDLTATTAASVDATDAIAPSATQSLPASTTATTAAAQAAAASDAAAETSTQKRTELEKAQPRGVENATPGAVTGITSGDSGSSTARAQLDAAGAGTGTDSAVEASVVAPSVKSSNATVIALAKVIEDLNRLNTASTSTKAAATAAEVTAAAAAAAAATAGVSGAAAAANVASTATPAAHTTAPPPPPLSAAEKAAVAQPITASWSPTAAAAAAAHTPSPPLLPPLPPTVVPATDGAAGSSTAAGSAAGSAAQGVAGSKAEPAASTAAELPPVSEADTASSPSPPAAASAVEQQAAAAAVEVASSESVSIEVSKVAQVLKDASAVAADSHQQALEELKQTLASTLPEPAPTLSESATNSSTQGTVGASASELATPTASGGGEEPGSFFSGSQGMALVELRVTMEFREEGGRGRRGNFWREVPSGSSLTTFNTEHLRLDSVPTTLVEATAASMTAGGSRTASPASPPTPPALAHSDTSPPTSTTLLPSSPASTTVAVAAAGTDVLDGKDSAQGAVVLEAAPRAHSDQLVIDAAVLEARLAAIVGSDRKEGAKEAVVVANAAAALAAATAAALTD
ncbi:MAG: hypothetical protein WDW38_000779 [Sanguina aurantia]